jgi:hypothetical protein
MAPVSASSQPSTATTPPAKENQMANVEAAKKAAAAPDRVAVIQVLRDGFPDMFGAGAPDDMVAEYFGDLLEAGVEDEAPGAPGDKKPPMMPGAEAKPPAQAVPLFTSAEDVARVDASATAQADELKTAKEQLAVLTASVKALQARELSGKIVNASASDRAPVTPKTFAERIREQRAAGMRS